MTVKAYPPEQIRRDKLIHLHQSLYSAGMSPCTVCSLVTFSALPLQCSATKSKSFQVNPFLYTNSRFGKNYIPCLHENQPPKPAQSSLFAWVQNSLAFSTAASFPFFFVRMTLLCCENNAKAMTALSLGVGQAVIGWIFQKVRGIHLGNYSAPDPPAPRQHVKPNEEYQKKQITFRGPLLWAATHLCIHTEERRCTAVWM